MSDSNNVTVEGSVLSDEIEAVCGEERDNNICGTRVGVVKQTEVGAMFVPVQGADLLLGPLEASARAQRGGSSSEVRRVRQVVGG
jgi:hypothetical protein